MAKLDIVCGINCAVNILTSLSGSRLEDLVRRNLSLSVFLTVHRRNWHLRNWKSLAVDLDLAFHRFPSARRSFTRNLSCFFQQIDRMLSFSSLPKEVCTERMNTFKTDLTHLANDYCSIKQDKAIFPLGREHLAAISELNSTRRLC